MDNKRLDEAVEVALDAWRTTNCTFGDTDALMRAALLAGVKVLLGEPAWFLCELYDDTLNYDEQVQFFRSRSEADEYEREGFKMTALYAPSLGEGDGR